MKNFYAQQNLFFLKSEHLIKRLKKRKIFPHSKIANQYQYAPKKKLCNVTTIIFRPIYFGLNEQ